MPAIIYESNTGFTRRYAELLSEKTDYELYHIRKGIEELPKSTEVFFLGWICGGKIEGLKLAQKYFTIAGCAAVGASTPSPQNTAQIIRTNKITAPFFYLRGGVAPEKLTPIKRKLLEMISKQLERDPRSTQENWDLADTLRFGGDFVKEENLAEILAWFETQK
ncbi:MAG TPA: hypothetical protein O0X39_04330 [Methanocorpusculum sp.]|nr:hypothetical protein [Methanocorpusculum sp.]